MIIKLFKELGRRMDKQSEKLEILTNVKNLNKLENVKKRNQTELKKKYTRRNQQNTRWYRGTIQSWETGKGKSLELNKNKKT